MDRLVLLLNVVGALHCSFMWGDKDRCAVWYSRHFGKYLLVDVGRQTVVSNQINMVTPPTLPPLLFLFCLCSYILQQLTRESNSSVLFYSGISLHVGKPLPQLILQHLCQQVYNLAMSPTGPPSAGLHRYAKVPTTHSFLLSIANSAWKE